MPEPAPVVAPTVLSAAGPNALARALGLLGDEWVLLIVRAALTGATRYSQFQQQMSISHAVLTHRLDTLVAEGLMAREVYQERPVRSEYVLTQRGQSIWPMLIAIWGWERQWAPSDSGRTPPMRHLVCGHEMIPVYRCRACGQPARAGDLDILWGPNGGWSRSVPEASTRRRSGRQATHAFYPDTMSVFGDRWSAALVGAAFRGLRRFGDFQDALGIPPSLLAERLAVLRARGILEQAAVDGRPDWSEYRLTAKGKALFPVVDLLIDWAQRWYVSEGGPVLERTHRTCGEPFRGALACDRCEVELHGPDIEIGQERGGHDA